MCSKSDDFHENKQTQFYRLTCEEQPLYTITLGNVKESYFGSTAIAETFLSSLTIIAFSVNDTFQLKPSVESQPTIYLERNVASPLYTVLPNVFRRRGVDHLDFDSVPKYPERKSTASMIVSASAIELFSSTRDECVQSSEKVECEVDSQNLSSPLRAQHELISSLIPLVLTNVAKPQDSIVNDKLPAHPRRRSTLNSLRDAIVLCLVEEESNSEENDSLDEKPNELSTGGTGQNKISPSIQDACNCYQESCNKHKNKPKRRQRSTSKRSSSFHKPLYLLTRNSVSFMSSCTIEDCE